MENTVKNGTCKLIEAINSCILNLTDDELINLELNGGRFYINFEQENINVGFSASPSNTDNYHESISHLISIFWDKNELLEFDQVTKKYISSSPEEIKLNLENWADKIFEDFIKFDSVFTLVYFE